MLRSPNRRQFSFLIRPCRFLNPHLIACCWHLAAAARISLRRPGGRSIGSQNFIGPSETWVKSEGWIRLCRVFCHLPTLLGVMRNVSPHLSASHSGLAVCHTRLYGRS